MNFEPFTSPFSRMPVAFTMPFTSALGRHTVKPWKASMAHCAVMSEPSVHLSVDDVHAGLERVETAGMVK